MDLSLIWPAALTAILLVGAVIDWRVRRLPNWLSLVLLVFGLAHGFYEAALPGLGWHALHAVVALLGGAALFAGGIIGGGDAKAYAGTAAYFTFGLGLKLLVFVTLAGGVTMILWMIGRRLFSRGPVRKDGDHAKFPYGVAIAVGASLLAWMQAGV